MMVDSFQQLRKLFLFTIIASFLIRGKIDLGITIGLLLLGLDHSKGFDGILIVHVERLLEDSTIDIS